MAKDQAEKLRLRLATIWWGSAAVLTLLMIILTVAVGISAAPTLWGWFMPNILPVLTLVGTASISNADQAVTGPAEDNRRRRLALGSSIFYLMLLSITTVMLFFSDLTNVISNSGLWLAPFQGLATSALGFFFFAKAR